VLAAGAAISASLPGQGDSRSPTLEGKSWQLVHFTGKDGETLAPDDGSKYTIEFAEDGQLYARVDCNRGRGTWKSGGGSSLELGTLALTRVKCAKGSLHDHIVERWESVRSYKLENERLFLSLASGGVYEFEPARRAQVSAVPETEFRGIVSSVTGVCPGLYLTVSGTTVRTTASTRFDSGGCHTLRVGLVVEVNGSRSADGSVVAARVHAEDQVRRDR
jgi:heat shock protein HslJ